MTSGPDKAREVLSKRTGEEVICGIPAGLKLFSSKGKTVGAAAVAGLIFKMGLRLWKKIGTGILALLVLALILSSTGVYAQTEDEQGRFTASKPLDWGNDKSIESFEAPMPGPFVVENGAVKMRASAKEDTGDYCYVVSVSFTGSYSSGKVSGKTKGTYNALRWGGGWARYEGEGEWSGQVDPKTGIGKGSYTVKLNRVVRPAPGFTGPDVTEPYSGTFSGTWETRFDIKPVISDTPSPSKVPAIPGGDGPSGGEAAAAAALAAGLAALWGVANGLGPNLSRDLSNLINRPRGGGGPSQQGPPDTTVDSSNSQGGSTDNQNTEFDGGDGPGRCRRIGLPNYWVNTATLNLVVQDTIFTYQGLGPAIVIALTYNASSKNRSGMFGIGWGLSYESMIEQAGEDILLWKGSGKRLSYKPGSPANRQSPDDPLEAVSQQGNFDRLLDYGEYWLFIEKDTRLMYRYDKSPGTNTSRLTAIADPNGNTVHIRYSADGTIQSITDAAGRSTSFSYDDNKRCISFTVPDGRTANFSYDGKGNLIQVKDMLGVPSVYEYDADQYMTRMIVGNDRRTTTFAYQNSAHGKCIGAVTDAGGNTRRYEMVSANPRQVRVIDPEGKVTEYHSAEGRTEKIVNPLGNSTVYGYAKDLRVSVQDRNGQTSRMEYDAWGNMTRHTDALGNATTFAFDAYDNLITETNPLGETWTYAYDQKHNLVKITPPMGRVQVFDHDPKGQLIAITDPNGHKTTFGYDNFGNLVTITDPLGHNTRMSYDPYGLTKTAITDARGNTTRYEHDRNNRLTKVTHPDGSARIHTYDCCTEISITDEKGNETKVMRSPLMDIMQWMDFLGNVTRYDYDRNSNPIRAIDALGRSTTLAYDDAGHMIQMMDHAGQTLRMRNDPEGNLISLWDERGKRTQFTYDAKNLLAGVIDPLGRAINITHDAFGRLCTFLNAREQQASFTYNSDGWVTGKLFGGDQAAAHEFDAVGNLTKVTDATGTTTYKYNAVNQVTSIRYPDGLEISFTYDEAGNISAINYSGGLVVEYTYDNRNRIARVAWGENSVSFRYDAVGNLVGESRSNGTESAYAHNANNQVIEIEHHKGVETFAHMTYTRDAMGNITGESGILPLEPVLPNIGVPTTYNDANQIVTRGSDRYTYDADGNLTEINGGKWHAVYDAENRPVEITRSGRTTRYTYNGLGERTKAVTGSSARQFYHDHMGRLMFETDGNWHIMACYIYRSSLLVARVKTAGESQFYHFDKIGNTLALTDTKGEVIAAYAYSPFSTVVNKSRSDDDNPNTYVGAFGVMDESDGLFFMKNRYYDAYSGRFIQKDPIGFEGGINLYAYVQNNPVSYIDPEGTLGPVSGGVAAGALLVAYGAYCAYSWTKSFLTAVEYTEKAEEVYKETDKVKQALKAKETRKRELQNKNNYGELTPEEWLELTELQHNPYADIIQKVNITTKRQNASVDKWVAITKTALETLPGPADKCVWDTAKYILRR